jgi:hypothetical protein
MTEDVFKLFWGKSSKEWYEKADFRVCDDAEKKYVKDYCEIKTEINVHIAEPNGRRCGAKRPRCGAKRSVILRELQ